MRLGHVANRRRKSIVPPVTSNPEYRTRPVVGSIRPVSIFRVIDLPEPFGPRYPRISPGRRMKLTSETAA